tara:strand:- start:253 stop:1371 length:1119 start_codon:yes stop_codon:yes gene_type:complete
MRWELFLVTADAAAVTARAPAKVLWREYCGAWALWVPASVVAVVVALAVISRFRAIGEGDPGGGDEEEAAEWLVAGGQVPLGRQPATLGRKRWTSDDEATLTQLHARFAGTREWTASAAPLMGRTEHSLGQRWKAMQKRGLVATSDMPQRTRRRRWTPGEETMLTQLHAEFADMHAAWTSAAAPFMDRTEEALRVHWQEMQQTRTSIGTVLGAVVGAGAAPSDETETPPAVSGRAAAAAARARAVPGRAAAAAAQAMREHPCTSRATADTSQRWYARPTVSDGTTGSTTLPPTIGGHGQYAGSTSTGSAGHWSAVGGGVERSSALSFAAGGPGAGDGSNEGGANSWMPEHYAVVDAGVIEVMAHPVPAGFAE